MGTSRLIGFLGAGIYEELLFRLMLLPVLFAVARGARLSPSASWTCAMVVGSLLFAAAHYRFTLTVGGMQFGPTAGDSFAWTTFAFRTAAGMFFSLLFLYRGFGVAAGAHAAYDILVESL
jgi:membrane protease YdiL (CAAX protease family)